ncbi:hypothetical protein LTR53_010792 [Teratosphaeriaceae sp. CCFEE 6253]|nr:hypothetical protein LTR53_010792 [Teratosphaeriaceae sp. CCFEE 6253]
MIAPPSYALGDRVLARFFSRLAARQTCLRCQEFILSVHRTSAPSSAMQFAIGATAYADLAVVQRDGGLAAKSCQAYVATLRHVQAQLDQLNTMDLAASHELCTAILVLDSFEVSVRVQALTQSRADVCEAPVHEASDAFSSTLLRAASPRIQARQLLNVGPSIATSIRSMMRSIGGPLDNRLADSVADACEMTRSLGEEMAWSAGAVSAESLASALHGLLMGMEGWLEDSNAIPIPRRTHVSPEQTAMWPFKYLGLTILTSDQIWVARSWIIIHMCYIRTADALLAYTERCLLQDHAKQLPPSKSLLERVATSADLLLSMTPSLIGLTDDDDGFVRPTPALNDTGLLIVQYPLWMIRQSASSSPEAKEQACMLLSFIEERRSIINRMP